MAETPTALEVLRAENRKLRADLDLWGQRHNASCRRVRLLLSSLDELVCVVRTLTTDEDEEQTEHTLPLFVQKKSAERMLRVIRAELTPEDTYRG